MKAITTLILCTLLGACASSGETSEECCGNCLEEGAAAEQAQAALPEVRYYVISDT
ncbi:MAG: hypothetical protein ACI8QS_001549 [Planctomycetota bacterium]|jgi:hypothetical protein